MLYLLQYFDGKKLLIFLFFLFFFFLIIIKEEAGVRVKMVPEKDDTAIGGWKAVSVFTPNYFHDADDTPR